MTNTSLLCSFNATEAILVIKLSAMPHAILDIVDVLQGAITMESNLTDPDESGENKSSLS